MLDKIKTKNFLSISTNVILTYYYSTNKHKHVISIEHLDMSYRVVYKDAYIQFIENEINPEEDMILGEDVANIIENVLEDYFQNRKWLCNWGNSANDRKIWKEKMVKDLDVYELKNDDDKVVYYSNNKEIKEEEIV